MNRLMQRAVWVLLLAGLFQLTSHAQTPMTLQKCIESALQHSRTLEARRAEYRAARYSAEAVRGDRLPSLSLNGSYSYQTETQEININSPMPNAQPMSIEFGDGDAVDAHLALQAPLFAGGSLRARQDAARHEARAAGFDVEADSLELLYQVRRAYFAALGASEQLQSMETLIARLERHVEQVRKVMEAGAASQEALVAARARLVEARTKREQALAAVDLAQQRLADVVGQPGKRVAPEGHLETTLPQVEESAVTFEKRPVLQGMEQRLARLDRERAAVDGAFQPMLSARATYHYANPGIDPVANEWMHYGTAGLQLSWTLWDWDSRSNRSQMVKASRQAVQQQKERLTESLMTAEASAKRQREAAERALELSRERLELERETLQFTRARYEQGRATETEYLDQQDALAEAEAALAQARVNVRLAEVDWLRARGY